MSEKVEAKLLCVENDSDWQKKIKDATNSSPGFHVDISKTYRETVQYLKTDIYDVCTLDSRLEDEKPRLSQMVKQVEEKSKEIMPVLVAVTAYRGDVTPRVKRRLFEVVDKREIGDDIVRLKRSVLEALNESLRLQAIDIWKKMGQKGVPESKEYLIKSLEDLPACTETNLRERAYKVVKKYEIYCDRVIKLPQVLLDCYGFVSAISENEVDVVLALPDGQDLRRVFDAQWCAAAGIHYQYAPFHYTVIREGADVRGHLEPGKPPADYQRSVNVPEIDLSVFDKFKPNGEIKNE